MTRRTVGHAISAFLLALTLVFSIPAHAQAPTAAPNPQAESVNEDMLFKQNSRIDGRVSIPDERSRFLIQPQGRDWRVFHEVTMPWIAGLAILGMLLALAIFYLVFGRIKGQYSETGDRIIRFRFVERFTHWMVATCFIVLALSGLNYIYGKRLLMPIMGPYAFAEMSQWMKYAHNFFAWPFTVGILIMVVVWVRDNLPSRVDFEWIKKGGGLTGRGHVSAGRFNAGQKIVFWGVTLGSLAMFVSGLALLFPFTITGVNGMQLTSIIHGIIGAVFIAGILAHIYIGSVGMEGAFEAMGSGTVDREWARQHHDLWADQADRAEPIAPAAHVDPARPRI